MILAMYISKEDYTSLHDENHLLTDEEIQTILSNVKEGVCIPENNIFIKKCKRCGQIFIPKRKSQKYCGIVCLNNARIYPDDDFARLRNSARNTQYKFLKKSAKDNKEYAAWSNKCAEKMKYFKQHNDLEGFSKWILQTRFSKAEKI